MSYIFRKIHKEKINNLKKDDLVILIAFIPEIKNKKF